jgi:hypothetical protein
MKRLFLAAAVIGVLDIAIPAHAQTVCWRFSSCDTAHRKCVARKSAGMSAANCYSSFRTCQSTGIWHGVSHRGPYQCQIRGR